MENPFESIITELRKVQQELAEIKATINRTPEESEQGGLELAKKLTGWSYSTIRRKVHEGELRVISAPYANLRFDKHMLLEDMKGSARKPKSAQLAEVQEEFKTLKRLRS